MTKHSKNNTASSVFTYAEYKKLDSHYGTKKQRLGAESMRQFDACSLCLQRAREPMACSRGHIYCRECVLSDLLKQKQDIKRHQVKLEAMAKEEEEQKVQAKAAARERVLLDFEKRHLGLGAVKRVGSSSGEGEQAALPSEARGTKRKFELDQDAVDKAAEEAEAAALKQIEVEQAEARRDKLPAFWLPSLTPSTAPGPLKDIKLQCLCHQSRPSHTMSLKSLVPIQFEFDKNGESSKDKPRTICPSCKKELSNSSNLSLLKNCSHVLCNTCIDTLVKPSHQCSVCDKPAKDKDIITMEREGTGYSAGGLAETKKAGIAFQG